MQLVVPVRRGWRRVLAVLCVIGGAATLLLGWLGVSVSVSSAEEIPYVVSGGFFGLFLLGLGSVLWLSADLREERGRLAGFLPECVGNRVPDDC